MSYPINQRIGQHLPIKKGFPRQEKALSPFQSKEKNQESISILTCKYKSICTEPCKQTYPACPYGLDNIATFVSEEIRGGGLCC